MRKKPLCLSDLQKDPFEEDVCFSAKEEKDKEVPDLSVSALILNNLPKPKEQATDLSLSGEERVSKRR